MEHDPPQDTPPSRALASVASTLRMILVTLTWVCVAGLAGVLARALAGPRYGGVATFVAMVSVGLAMPRMVPLFPRRLTDRDRELLGAGSAIGAGLGFIVYMLAGAAMVAFGLNPARSTWWALPLSCVLGTSVTTAYLLASTGPSYRRHA